MNPTEPALLAVLTAGALLLWPRPGTRTRYLRPPRPTPVRPSSVPTAARRAVLAAVAAAAVLALLGTGPLALAVAVGSAVAVDRQVRRSVGRDQAEDAALRRDIPVACDLLGACLVAGSPVSTAVAAVAQTVPGPVGGHLREVAALLTLGAEPRTAWAGVPADLQPLGRTVVRAGESGSAIGPALHRLALDARAAERARVQAAVGRAGVWVLAPLGACFLPAFLCLGVVPLVLGIAADVLG